MVISRGYVIIPNPACSPLMLGQSNVVVDADGHARITDFRFATVAADADSEQTTPDKHFESRQWPALEILVGGAASKETDIFSFAMVMIEVLHKRSTPCIALSNPCFNTGIHRDNSARQYSTHHDNDGHRGRQTPVAACTSGRHGGIVEVDKTVLGRRPLLTPGSFGSLANSPRLVSFSLVLVIICKLDSSHV